MRRPLVSKPRHAAAVLALAGACAVHAGSGRASRDAAAAGPPLAPATAAEILAEVRRPGAGAVLLNVWATWCLPCREEFPDLVRLERTYRRRGLRLVLVAADFEDDREARVREFLREHGVRFASFLKEGDDAEFIDAIDARWSGALPVTLLYDANGRPRAMWEGQTTYDVLERGVRDILERAGDKEGS
jgi:thiol-disulfide isomerase/thioredoxin